MEKVTNGMSGLMGQLGKKIAGSHLGLKLSTTALTHTEIKINGHLVCVKQRLAEGGFGLVDLVTEPSTNTDYVLKRCGIQRREIFDTVQKEIKILQQFAGPYLVEYCGSEILENNGTREALILLKYCPGGHLLEKLNSLHGSHPPIGSVYKIFGQILLALKSFHEHNPPVVHRDLKLENVLFGADGNVRLCDFGSCCIGHTFLRTADERAAAEEIIGKETTQMYRAPEMVDLYRRNVLTEKTDIWALGCIFYALCYLSHPFQDASNLGILNARIKIHTEVPIPADAVTLITRMLDVDPEARPSVAELFEALSEIACDRPLPPYHLTEEALKCRTERLEAEQREKNRVRVNKKPAPTPVVPKRVTPPVLSANSVAAKRLAAKKGGVPSNSSSAQSIGSTELLPISTHPQQEYFDESRDDGYGSSCTQQSRPPIVSHFEANFDSFHLSDTATIADSLFDFKDSDDVVHFGASSVKSIESESAGVTADQYLFDHPTRETSERDFRAENIDNFDHSSTFVDQSVSKVSPKASTSGFDEFDEDFLENMGEVREANPALRADVDNSQWNEFTADRAPSITQTVTKRAPDPFASNNNTSFSEGPFGVFSVPTTSRTSGTSQVSQYQQQQKQFQKRVPKPSMEPLNASAEHQSFYFSPEVPLKPPTPSGIIDHDTIAAVAPPKPPKPVKPPRPSIATSNSLLDLDFVDSAGAAAVATTVSSHPAPLSLLDLDIPSAPMQRSPIQTSPQNANIMNLFDTYTPVTYTKRNI